MLLSAHNINIIIISNLSSLSYFSKYYVWIHLDPRPKLASKGTRVSLNKGHTDREESWDQVNNGLEVYFKNNKICLIFLICPLTFMKIWCWVPTT